MKTTDFVQKERILFENVIVSFDWLEISGLIFNQSNCLHAFFRTWRQLHDLALRYD